MSQALSDDDDAVPPPIGFSSTSGYSSRPSRSQRPSTDRSRFLRSHKTLNDVRVKPASENVINDLLSSFSTITPTTDTFPGSSNTLLDDDLSFSRPRTPLRPSRPESRDSNARYASSDYPRPNRGTYARHLRPDPTQQFVEVSHPAQSPEDLPPEEDAAIPPVVRTSRPPSGLTKATASHSEAPARSLSKKISSPRLIHSPPAERATPYRGTPRQVMSPAWNGSHTPRDIGSSRPSVDIATGRVVLPNTPTSVSKGKSKEAPYTPRASSMRSNAYEGQRAGRVFSPPLTARGSAAPSARASIDIDRPPGVAGPSYSRGTRQDLVLEDDELDYGATGDGRVVPARRSSLQTSPPKSITMREGRRSKSSIPSSPEMSRRVPLNADDSLPEGTLPLPQRVIVDDDSDDNEVSRRIQELKQQREERRRSMENTKPSFGTPSIGMPSVRPGGLSTKASAQLREAPPAVEEYRISDEQERREDNYALDVPPTISIESRPLKQSSRSASKGRTNGPSSYSFVSPTPKLSSDVSRPSRQNSQTKRWHPTVGAGRGESARRADADRAASPMVFRGASIDTRRTSVDSVKASVKEYLASPRLTQRIEIAGENRRVVFSEVGDPKGYVVLCCVGMGLTRYVMAFYDELATSLGLRLITPERPGIGESDAYADGPRTPMSWPDDVQAICDHLRITRFSMLAHSAGAIYALATALRLPHYLRGKIHLLAPWIPPSQLVQTTYNLDRTAAPVGMLPRSQRLLRMLPSSFLKLSNSSFASFGSRSGSPKPPKNGRSRRSTETGKANPKVPTQPPALPLLPLSYSTTNLTAPTASLAQPPSPHLDSFRHINHPPSSMAHAAADVGYDEDAKKERQRAYDEQLTPMIWDLATSNANPSVDLLICLERHRTIGFSYTDVGAKPATKTIGERPGRIIDLGAEVDGNQWPEMGVVIHHGSKDARVPVENVRWLGQRMYKCEVKILDGLGHGLMGEAGVMGGVLSDISREWEANGGFRKRRSERR